jgi:PPOX class probable F420-dependent enzyme
MNAEPVSWQWVEERLESTHNYWLATVGRDARPYVRPVWCVWVEGHLLFTSSATSAKARNLRANPSVSIHLELVREVIVVEGEASELQPTDEALAAYEAKYAWHPPASQAWYSVRPSRIDAADEATYPASAATFAL